MHMKWTSDSATNAVDRELFIFTMHQIGLINNTKSKDAAVGLVHTRVN